MEIFLSPFIIIPLVLLFGFCGIVASMLLPLYIKDEYKDQFESKAEVLQTPYLYQSKWFKPRGVLFQRMALAIWIPAIIIAIYFWLSGGLDGVEINTPKI